MKKAFLLLLLPALFITGCSDDEPINTIGLENQWNLVEIYTPFVAQGQTFEKGSIVWTFNEIDREIDVVNNSGNNDAGLSTGTYGYTIGAETNACNEALFIEESDFGCLTISGDTLIATKEYVDGPRYTFVR